MLRLPAFEVPPHTPALSAPLPVVYVSEPVIWEYKQVTGEQALDETELNELGRDGWELAGILTHDAQVIFYFKRHAR